MDGARVQVHKAGVAGGGVHPGTPGRGRGGARVGGDGGRTGPSRPDPGRGSPRFPPGRQAPPVPDHHAPVRPQARCRRTAPGAAPDREFLRLPLPGRRVPPRRRRLGACPCPGGNGPGCPPDAADGHGQSRGGPGSSSPRPWPPGTRVSWPRRRTAPTRPANAAATGSRSSACTPWTWWSSPPSGATAAGGAGSATFTWGARDPVGGSFVMLGKTFKGLTDAMLTEQTEFLQRLETARDRHTVYVRPEAVVEVAFNDLQASPQYPRGSGAQIRPGQTVPARQAPRPGGYHRDRTRDPCRGAWPGGKLISCAGALRLRFATLRANG